MKELELVFRGAERLKCTIKVDGKAVKLKKNNYGAKICNVQTEKDQVLVEVYKDLELAGKLWFLMNIIYFFISLFGILDIPYDRKCIVVDCKFLVKVNQKSKVVVFLNRLKDQGKAAEIESNTKVKELSNHYYIDKKIKKRWIVALVTRLVLLVTAVVLLVVFVF